MSLTVHNTHACPGCGQQIGNWEAACGPCFQQLPVDLRRAATAADPFQDVTAFLNTRRDVLDHIKAQRGAPTP